jgi:aminoglycoside phosphotransferase
MASGSPRSSIAPPAPVLAVADGRPVRPVWVNDLGGITFEIGADGQRRFVKWTPAGSGIDLAAEAARMRWAVAFTSVPRVLGEGADATGSWLVTSALPGEMAVTSKWRSEPHAAVTAIGQGLRALHDALPVRDCPFSWSASDRLADARRRASQGLLDKDQWHPGHRHLSVPQALDLLEDIPAVEELVVCHGDSCAPNTLLTDDGRWSGHVDLGALGVADRWADLAVATWSATWNYGPGWEPLLLEAYGVAPDPARTRYYRLLWDQEP